MKLLSSTQLADLDKMSIETEEISSVELMKRASGVFFAHLIKHVKGNYNEVFIFCGSGNNGGDGLCVANLCVPFFQQVTVVDCKISPHSSIDRQQVFKELSPLINIQKISEGDDINLLLSNTLVIDAIFGSGLNRDIEGYWATLIQYINQSNCYVCSIDIPSGMFSDLRLTKGNVVISSDWTLSFEMPKLSFFISENFRYMKNWDYESIGLSKGFWNSMDANNYFIDEIFISEIFSKRKRDDHKGSCGHAALICGSPGMMGAAVLSSKGCLRSGVGKLSVFVPENGLEIIQSQVYEAICEVYTNSQWNNPVKSFEKYQAIGIGCGIGVSQATKDSLLDLIKNINQPLVLDADALNIIAEENWLDLIPNGSILTPHIGEINRLIGQSKDSLEMNNKLLKLSKTNNIYIIKKGPNTALFCPSGDTYYNKTGNPGMATAGSGDVLTGIITSIGAQGYSLKNAAIMGIYFHGLAGDYAAKEKGISPIIASDIIDYLPYAIKEIEDLL